MQKWDYSEMYKIQKRNELAVKSIKHRRSVDFPAYTPIKSCNFSKSESKEEIQGIPSLKTPIKTMHKIRADIK